MGLGSTSKLKAMDVFEEISSPLCPVELRAKVYKLEAVMKQSQNQVECPVTHHFSKGVYAREVFIPAGTIAVGHVHKTKNMNILSQGTITVLTEDGPKTLTAPATIVSEAGVKRAAFAHTDVVWTTIHATEETDIEKIKEEFILDTGEPLGEEEMSLLMKQGEVLCLG